MFRSRPWLQGVALVAAVLLAVPAQAGPCGAVVSYKSTSYSASYQHHYQDYVPVVQAVQAVPDFYYSSRDFARDDALLEAVKALREQLQARGASVEPSAADALDELPALNGSVSPVASGPRAGSIEALVKAECLRCHDGSGKSAFSLTNVSALSPVQVAKVHVQVQLGKMPPQRPLDEAKKKVFEDFVNRVSK